MRTILSPTFTGSKMRSMSILMETCVKQVIDFIKEQKQIVYETDVRDVFSRYANDVIATCAFGLQCDSLKMPNNEFFLMGKKGADSSGLRGLVYLLSAESIKLLGLKLTPSDVNKFFTGIIRDTLKVRRDKGIVRQDMINLMLQVQNGTLKYKENSEVNAKPNSILTDLDIAAQAYIFFIAGFGTNSILMSFTAYELAINPEIQLKLFQEIKENCSEDINYETVTKLKYLDMVVSESLRKWPPEAISDRKVTKDITIQPERDGELSIFLEKGSICWWSIYASQRDPKNFPNPDKFDPERFSEENKRNFNSSAFIPFGIGPRACIGSRFTLLETKLLLVNLLKEFEIVPVQKTKIPLELDKGDYDISSVDGFWLGFRKRS